MIVIYAALLFLIGLGIEHVMARASSATEAPPSHGPHIWYDTSRDEIIVSDLGPAMRTWAAERHYLYLGPL